MGEVKSFRVRFEALADGGDKTGAVRRISPAEMSADDRLALLADIDAGQVLALKFKALAFGSGPNLNNARLYPDQIDELAQTAAGVDLLADHGWSVSDTVGAVLSGEARDEGSERVLVLDHELTEPNAMRAFVRGLWRRFSIALEAAGWEERGDVAREIWAVSPVRLVHNAFVSDPAYKGARVVANQARERKMEKETQDGAQQVQAARIAELEGALAGALATIDELKASLAKREEEAFGAAFDRAAAEGRVLPSAREQFSAIRKTAGLDAVCALFGAYPKQAALPTETTGHGDAPKADGPKYNPNEIAARIFAAGGGKIKEAKQ